MHLHFVQNADVIGALLSFISTLFYIRASAYAWPMSLIAIFVNTFLYASTGLYGDVAKESIYFISCILGWYWWLRGGHNKERLPITNLTAKHGLILSGITGMSICLLALTLIHCTDSQVPYWDATTTILSLSAQWLICRKIIESWILWFIVDTLYTSLYFYKGLPAHGLLLIVYMGMAVVGYFSWFTKSRTNSKHSWAARSAEQIQSGIPTPP